MRVAVVGPTHPIKGGVAQHTTVLATRLAAAGHDVQIVSWSRQYPARLYPGQQTVERPEFPPFTPTHRTLAWNRPDSWVREARRLRHEVDLVVIAHITQVQVPPYRTMLAVLKGGPRTVVVCHNVLPHERGRADEVLVASLLRAPDAVLVHSEAQAEIARALTDRPVVVAPIAPFMPVDFVAAHPAPGEHRRLLFFGIVRPYKGLDVLLRALARGPSDVRLRVVGEFWGGTDATSALCRELGIEGRVELVGGYLPADEVPGKFRDVDALVLPYRTATGSQGVWTGFEFGVPVIATRAGHLADDVRDGVDGLVVPPGDVDALAAAIEAFYRPGEALRLRAEVRPVDPAPYWHRYLTVLLGAVRPDTESEGTRMQKAAPPGGRLLHLAKLGAEEVLWGRVGLRRALDQAQHREPALPAPVQPTDVLSTTGDADRAIAECKRLGYPLHHDRPKNWDALGAVSIVLNELGRDVRVLDAGAARYSPILPWLRIAGVRDLVGNNLEFVRTRQHGSVRFEPGDITDMPYRDGWFDAITCMSVIEHGVPIGGFLRESARVLRPGGVLVVSTDYDQEPPDTTGKQAYGVPVHIFGPQEISALVTEAAGAGLELMGPLQLHHDQRPVHWKRTGLDYTFIRLAFRRS